MKEELYMLKKSVFGMLALFLGVVLLFALFSCEGLNPSLDPKSLIVTGISDANTILRVAVQVLVELPSITSLPLPVAVGQGSSTGPGGTGPIDLKVPQDNALYDGPAWTGNGDYYVSVAIDRGPYLYFTGSGETPVKVAFDKAQITLDFSKFKVWAPE